MPRIKKIFIFLAVAIFLLPLSASASWFWNKPTAGTKSNIASPKTAELSPADKALADAKYKLWSDSFDKDNVDAVIANQNMFWFTVPELNYIFESATKKVKNPVLTNFNLTASGGSLSVSADFQKIIRGHFSFTAQVDTSQNKARLNLSKLKFYGLPVPASWLGTPLNKALDEYFSFLYRDPRYQNFNFSDMSGTLKLQPIFK